MGEHSPNLVTLVLNYLHKLYIILLLDLKCMGLKAQLP
jgi:hypothetical protein